MTTTAGTGPTLTYARARLTLGASAVGFLALASAAALAFDLPALFATRPGDALRDAAQVAAFLSVYVALLAPFDLMGGWLAPRAYGRSHEPLAAFVVRWLRGAALHATFLGLVAVALLLAARTAGTVGTLLAVAAIATAQLAVQPWLGALVGGWRLRRPHGADAATLLGGRTLELLTHHPHVTGGAYGLPGRGGWVVPTRWLEGEHAVDHAALARRRAWTVASGARARGLGLALAWNAVPLIVALGAFGAPDAVADVVRLALLSTVWSFVGALLLPTPSRWAVHHADLAAAPDADAAERLLRDLRALERDQDDEFERGPVVEAIFHPLPSLARRAAVLRGVRRPGPASAAAWHAARSALYLSWSTMGLLGRAVHCNLGRPEAWVFLPSD